MLDKIFSGWESGKKKQAASYSGPLGLTVKLQSN
jgi:hypothetical protein